MPEDHPGTISLFVDWLYGEKVLEGNSQSHLDSLYHLYFFATKINESDLMDASIDRIQHISNDVNRYIRPEMLKLVYENIPENSRLRVFNSRLYRYGLYQRHKKKVEKEFKEKIADSRERGWATDHLKRNRDSFEISSKDKKALWNISRDCFDLFGDVMDVLQRERWMIFDPRKRYDNPEGDTCFFNVHPEYGKYSLGDWEPEVDVFWVNDTVGNRISGKEDDRLQGLNPEESTRASQRPIGK